MASHKQALISVAAAALCLALSGCGGGGTSSAPAAAAIINHGVLSGPADPTAATGSDGDFYLNSATRTLFGPKTGGAWPSGVSLAGAAGPTGATGAAGANGTNGTNGVDGAAGATGAAGPQGIQGPAGAPGTMLGYGNTDPTAATGNDGDFYLNITTSTLFGPKASGAWPAGVSMIGPTGATGATGPTGAAGANGTNGTNGATGATGASGAAFYVNYSIPNSGTIDAGSYFATPYGSGVGSNASGTDPWTEGVLLPIDCNNATLLVAYATSANTSSYTFELDSLPKADITGTPASTGLQCTVSSATTSCSASAATTAKAGDVLLLRFTAPARFVAGSMAFVSLTCNK